MAGPGCVEVTARRECVELLADPESDGLAGSIDELAAGWKLGRLLEEPGTEGMAGAGCGGEAR